MSLPRYEPMLATSWPAPVDEPGWSHEIKWDGVRIVAGWEGGRVTLRSRRGNDVTSHYPEIPAGVGDALVLDGEIVAIDEGGRPSFSRLQRRMHVASPSPELVAAVPVSFVVFDLLHDGDSLLGLPWEERRDRLERVDLPAPLVLTDTGDDGPALYEAAIAHGLEGVVSKRRASPYRPGRRSPDWRKVAHRTSVRAVVGGFLPGEAGRTAGFSSLLLGMGDGEGLRFVGAVGSGFDHDALGAIREALDEMEVPSSPFGDNGSIPAGARWVEPRLVAVVEHAGWTPAGRLRAPVFKGFSPDPPESVAWAEEGPATGSRKSGPEWGRPGSA